MSLLDPVHIHFPPTPKPPLTYFLSLWVCLLWTFHIKGIIRCVVLCVWLLPLDILFPRFIYVVACFHTSFFFNDQLSIHWQQWRMLPWAVLYTFLCGHVCLLLLGMYLRREMLCNMIGLGFSLSAFSKVGALVLHSYQHCTRIMIFLQPYQQVVIFLSNYLSHSRRCKVASHCFNLSFSDGYWNWESYDNWTFVYFF